LFRKSPAKNYFLAVFFFVLLAGTFFAAFFFVAMMAAPKNRAPDKNRTLDLPGRPRVEGRFETPRDPAVGGANERVRHPCRRDLPCLNARRARSVRSRLPTCLPRGELRDVIDDVKQNVSHRRCAH
jgi:hypothetical protein